MFRDRTDAGDRLADALRERGVEADVVLAIPRGGLPLGRAVADRLDAPLDVVVAKKIGAPHNPELAIGAVAENGALWLNQSLIDDVGVREDYVDDERVAVSEAASEKARRYRQGPPPDLSGKRVVVVDDGVATGATMRACLKHVRDEGPASVVVAVPVGPRDSIEELRAFADEVVVLEIPAAFRAVGAYFRNFDQVSDAEAQSYLH
ncbi:Predicted phosphoribosyltransferase [Halomicrobium zhouii]|uniref:Predicted phosphoribosyltransferase n=1 Tax=Halomicrobium zhouii TaxID=767519 RepID=A0A1I6LE06_9EURY|nr:phosphoribosyltransferase family protein [Halomicrobium zhouii]SFS01673.1 Predicted phosphoribosyltransferase [Halomicrobium zhouii]